MGKRAVGDRPTALRFSSGVGDRLKTSVTSRMNRRRLLSPLGALLTNARFSVSYQSGSNFQAHLGGQTRIRTARAVILSLEIIHSTEDIDEEGDCFRSLLRALGIRFHVSRREGDCPGRYI